eukprot:3676954-Rhodomonas_salina.1
MALCCTIPPCATALTDYKSGSMNCTACEDGLQLACAAVPTAWKHCCTRHHSLQPSHLYDTTEL